MKKTVLLITLTLLLIACASRKEPLPKLTITKTEKDSISRKTSVRDTVLIVQQADTASISRLINELNEIPTRIKSKQATISLKKVGNEIQAECVCEELKAAVKIYQETIERYKTIIETQEETIVQLQTQIPGWAKPFLWLGIAVTVGIFGLAALFIIKNKPF